jgi:hypothetical protein
MNPKTTAKDFFLYLGVIIGLYVSSVSFLMLAFQIIDKVFPLAGEYVGNYDSSIRSSLAALIIFFPAFIYVSYLANKGLLESPEKKEMWVRRWMIFLTLFVAGLTIAIDLTTLIYRFLGAEDLTLRFFLKVFFVLVVAITVFRSVLNDYKRTSFEITKGIKNFMMIVSAVILSGIIYGIIIIGSPASQRARMMDEQRINDLSGIQSQIVYTQWQNKGEVPQSLDSLKDPISGYTLPTDPETKESYEYKMISKNSFELCATFKSVSLLDASNKTVARPVSYPYVDGMINENWQHKAEKTCFTRTIDEKLYPLNTKNRL